MIKTIVLDTNILVSALLSATGKPTKIVEMVLDKEIQVYYSQPILDEYENVLFRSKFGFNRELAWMVIDAIRDTGVLATPKQSTFGMPDEDDRIFYDTAKDSGAILVTGNKKHYPDEPFVLTAAEFLGSYKRVTGGSARDE